MKRILLYAVTAVAFLSSGATLRAQTSDEIDFDIFERNGQIAVWVNLSSLMTSKRIDDIKAGIDLAIDYELTLHRPRRLWGTQKIDQAGGLYQIGYRMVTEDYFVSPTGHELSSERYFLSLPDLHKYLADSIVVDLSPIEPLDEGKRYFLQAKITCISLTRLNVANGDSSPDSSQSAIKWLFKGFLDLTNFGREDYEFRSRNFSPSEIISEQ